jgi:hypothetical protein
MRWCHDGVEAAQFAVYVDGVRTVLTGVAKDPTPNAAGLYEYWVTVATVNGTHTYEVAAISPVSVEGSKSGTFTLTANLTAPPKAPTKLKVG